MTDDSPAASPSQTRRRCGEMIRTESGWERCHLDAHDPRIRHHVRDRSWLSTENTPRLRLGQPCGAACTWPDQVVPYRRAGAGRMK